MKLKIVSDGTPKNTTIIDAKTGEALEGITYINWSISAKGKAKCGIILNEIPLNIVADNIQQYELSNKNENSSS